MLNNQDLTTERRLKAKDERIAELLDTLRQAIADIERTGYVTVPTCITMEEAIREAKENDDD